MRSVQFRRFGEPAEVLTIMEAPKPVPDANQVLIRLTHRAVNPSDLSTIRGQYGRLPQLPATPGYEGTGIIEELGDGVKGWEVGQRIIPLGLSSGTWVEYGLSDPERMLAVHPAVSDQTAAQFVVNPVTAWVMVRDELELKPGEWLLQTAAGSTLGRLNLQIAKLRDFRMLSLVRRPEQVSELLDLGADAVICTEDGNVLKQVREITRGGAHAAIEAVGGETGALAISCLRPGGKMLAYGQLSGQATPLNWGEMLFRGLTVRGFWLSHWFRATSPLKVAQSLQELMTLMAQGHLLPPVETEYDLADIVAAVKHAERPGRSGKVLLTG